MSNIVMQRLSFARRRLSDLKDLGDAGLMSNTDDRQRLIQEFLFHLVGSIEFLAQEMNQFWRLNIPKEEVKPWTVAKQPEVDKSIKCLLEQLHPKTKGEPLPQDPYSPEGMHFRIIMMRNYVCHVGMNPFLFRVGSTPTVSLLLDLRSPNSRHSDKHALGELEEFNGLVESKCRRVLALLVNPAQRQI